MDFIGKKKKETAETRAAFVKNFSSCAGKTKTRGCERLWPSQENKDEWLWVGTV